MAEEKECPNCGGTGMEIIGEHFVSRDMALDACEPSMEGMHHSYEEAPCSECNGAGKIKANLK